MESHNPKESWGDFSPPVFSPGCKSTVHIARSLSRVQTSWTVLASMAEGALPYLLLTPPPNLATYSYKGLGQSSPFLAFGVSQQMHRLQMHRMLPNLFISLRCFLRGMLMIVKCSKYYNMLTPNSIDRKRYEIELRRVQPASLRYICTF